MHKEPKWARILAPIIAGTTLLCAASVQADRNTSAPLARKAGVAVRRALPLIQRSGQLWLERSSCTSCHHQSLAFVALKVSKDNGFRIDEAALAGQVTESNKRRFKYTDQMYELTGAANAVSGHGYQLLALAALCAPPNRFTDAAGFYLTAMQSEKGHWPSSSHRPPIEDSAFTLTATSIRALRAYPWGGQSEVAIRKAKNWLIATPAGSAEDRAMKLFGLVWSQASREQISSARRAIFAEQQPDGGWSQVRDRPSDSYATGQALIALRASGDFSVRSAAFVRGAKFLISSQRGDGSWRVPTRRVVSGLPYFETGFPHGVDQFISMAGTAWATMALAVYSNDGRVGALTGEKAVSGAQAPLRLARTPADQPVFQAILHGTNRELQAALKNGGNPNAKSVGGSTALMLAVRNPEMVKTLLAAGADPNKTSAFGSTALTLASATCGALPSMRLLLAAKADPNKGNAAEVGTPLAAAVRTSQPERLNLLLERGASKVQDAFFKAYPFEDLATVEILISKGARVNAENEEYGGNAVNDAVINRNPELLRLLLRHGGNPNVIDKEGFSPLQVAALGDPADSQIVSMLLEAGADTNYESRDHAKALVLATRRGNKASAELIRAAMDRIPSR